jgi:nitrogen regulatory protein PII-like uncharacterized protein
MSCNAIRLANKMPTKKIKIKMFFEKKNIHAGRKKNVTEKKITKFINSSYRLIGPKK